MFSQPCWRWKQFWPSAFNWSTNKSGWFGMQYIQEINMESPQKNGWSIDKKDRLNRWIISCVQNSPRIFHCYPNPLGKWFVFMGQFSWQIVRFSLTTFSIWDQVAMLSTNAALETRLLVHAACETSTVLCTAGWNRRIGVVAERPLV